VRRGSALEFGRPVQKGFVPLMRRIEAFRGYYLLGGGPDVLITISMLTAPMRRFYPGKTAAWVRQNLLEFTKGMPEVMIGNALIAEVKQVLCR
jgi:hypothetical protein